MEISQLDGLLGGFTLVHVKIHSDRRKRTSQKDTLLKSKKGRNPHQKRHIRFHSLALSSAGPSEARGQKSL